MNIGRLLSQYGKSNDVASLFSALEAWCVCLGWGGGTLIICFDNGKWHHAAQTAWEHDSLLISKSSNVEATWPREGHITCSDLENRIKASVIARSNCHPDLSLAPSLRAWPGRWLNPVIWFSHNQNSTRHTPAALQIMRTEVALFSYLLFFKGLFFAAVAGGNAFPNKTGCTLNPCGCIVWKSHAAPSETTAQDATFYHTSA